MQPLRVELLSVSEVQSFALHELADALGEVLHGVSELGREAISARKALSDVRTSWLRKDGRFANADDYGASLEEARALCEVLALRRGVLRDIRSILQSQCKSIV